MTALTPAQWAGLRAYVQRCRVNDRDCSVILYERNYHGEDRVRAGDLLREYDTAARDRDTARAQNRKLLAENALLRARLAQAASVVRDSFHTLSDILMRIDDEQAAITYDTCSKWLGAHYAQHRDPRGRPLVHTED